MLMPKKQKYRKSQKGRRRTKGQAKRGTMVNFGDFGLKTLEYSWITSRQIEAVRRAITRALKKKGRIWIRIFPNKPVTVKSSETPMGKGKGTVDHYVAAVKPGKVLFEISGVSEELAKRAFQSASYKLPVKTKFLKKQGHQ